jgi:hypothetical protein
MAITFNSELQQQMTSELKRQNRFWIVFPDVPGASGRTLSMAVKASARPKFAVSEQPIHHLNTPWFVAGKPTWETWTCNFYDYLFGPGDRRSDTFNIMQSVLGWYKLIYNPGPTNTNSLAMGAMGAPYDYKHNVDVLILGPDLDVTNPAETWHLYNAWPMSIDTGSLDMASDGAPLELNVTWRFDYANVEPNAGSSSIGRV